MADGSPFRFQTANESAGFLLWKLTALWQRRLATVFSEFEITQTQYAILASLRWFEEQGTDTSQSALATHAGLEAMTLSKAIRQLEFAGHVQRKPARHDSRAVHVRLSAKGRALTGAAIKQVEQADEDFFGALNSRQQASYRALVITLIAGNAPV